MQCFFFFIFIFIFIFNLIGFRRHSNFAVFDQSFSNFFRYSGLIDCFSFSLRISNWLKHFNRYKCLLFFQFFNLFNAEFFLFTDNNFFDMDFILLHSSHFHEISVRSFFFNFSLFLRLADANREAMFWHLMTKMLMTKDVKTDVRTKRLK